MPPSMRVTRRLPAALGPRLDRLGVWPGVFAELLLGEVDQFAIQARMLGRTDREYQRAVAVLGHVGVPHRAVDVDALACLEHHRGVELHVDLDGTLEYV